MPLTEKQRTELERFADENGFDREEFLAEAERQVDANVADDTEGDGKDQKPRPAPGENDAAAGGAAGQESGAKAHGGRGYFAYEYPFLRVNEVRASLFLPPLDDGDMFTGEWLAKHGGSGNGAAGGEAPPQ